MHPFAAADAKTTTVTPTCASDVIALGELS